MAEGARRVNWFAIWVSIAVVVALVSAAVLVVTLNNGDESADAGQDPETSNIEADTGAILVGDGRDRLDTYIDFMCPVCGQFEQIYGEEIAGMAEDGSITLGIHPISILDRASQGTEFSTRAANAMYCVAEADAEASLPFLRAMFANQPDEGTPGLTDDQLLQVAEAVGVTGIDECVIDRTYAGFVAAMTEKTPVQPGSEGIGTPTVAVNGEAISNRDLPEPGQLSTLFE